MIIVTGGAGFIGSNLVKALNQKGYSHILVVDDLSNGRKFQNLVDCQISDYFDKDDFIEIFSNSPNYFGKIEGIFHQGACSDTTEWDGRMMMRNNYEYSKKLLGIAQHMQFPFIYASSAAVYGMTNEFRELPEFEKPLNIYGYSKLLFDQYVRRVLPLSKSQIVGLRYFNVYGPREAHKQNMASVAYHHHIQIQDLGYVKLFEGSDGYGAGEQRRDFIYIDDVVNVNLWFLENVSQSGIFNVGTGRSQTFNELSQAVIHWHGKGKIEYIPFPEHLKGCYQSFTQADISSLRRVGYEHEFKNVQQGVKAYLDTIKKF